MLEEPRGKKKIVILTNGEDVSTFIAQLCTGPGAGPSGTQ
jgi:hypothetical protein